jgi:tetratricopeptide (TPR) repeat protein
MTQQTYDALISYTRFDDDNDGARLTTFRERLSREVRAHSGNPFQIFQDVEDITWGQQFKQRIDETLQQITFFIPILTPSFFKSEWCRYELERFLEHEARQGRNDLILPVYYIRVPALEDPARRAHDPLAQTLAVRQWMDWRDLRFETFEAPQVRHKMAQMAQQIADALDTPPPAPGSIAADYVKRGDEHREAKRYQQAIEAYTEALRLDLSNVAAYNHRGIAYYKWNKYEQAIADYSQAIALRPQDVSTYYHNRGLAYHKWGKQEQAIPDFDHAIKLDPQYATAYFNRGAAHKDLGNTQQAIADFEQYLQLEESDLYWREKAEEHLRELRGG